MYESQEISHDRVLTKFMTKYQADMVYMNDEDEELGYILL